MEICEGWARVLIRGKYWEVEFRRRISGKPEAFVAQGAWIQKVRELVAPKYAKIYGIDDRWRDILSSDFLIGVRIGGKLVGGLAGKRVGDKAIISFYTHELALKKAVQLAEDTGLDLIIEFPQETEYRMKEETKENASIAKQLFESMLAEAGWSPWRFAITFGEPQIRECSGILQGKKTNRFPFKRKGLYNPLFQGRIREICEKTKTSRKYCFAGKSSENFVWRGL